MTFVRQATTQDDLKLDPRNCRGKKGRMMYHRLEPNIGSRRASTPLLLTRVHPMINCHTTDRRMYQLWTAPRSSIVSDLHNWKINPKNAVPFK